MGSPLVNSDSNQVCDNPSRSDRLVILADHGLFWPLGLPQYEIANAWWFCRRDRMRQQVGIQAVVRAGGRMRVICVQAEVEASLKQENSQGKSRQQAIKSG